MIQDNKRKLDVLKQPQAEMFEELFNLQEKIAKKGNPGELLDKNGKVVTETVETPMQQGGIMDLATEYNIPQERALELMKMAQQGMEQPQDANRMQQIFQTVSQMLQQGMPPEEIAQQLSQMGVPSDQIEQIIMQVAQQIQAPQNEQQPMQQGGGFTFSTKYKPNITGYDVEGNSVVDVENLENVESMQPYTGKGYGAQMSEVNKTINAHNWYFDTEEKKQAFREASMKEGEQPEIKQFQEAYNKEIEKRAKDAGVPEAEIKNVIKEVGFTGEGVQKFDGKFGAFTSTRPLFNFSKQNGEVKAEIVATPSEETTVDRSITKNVLPNLPIDLRLTPSALTPLNKEQISLDRIEPIKATLETMLAEQERQRQADVERVQMSGLPPQMQEAILAQGLSSSQMASNDAISKTENFNAQNQFQADQFNIGQAGKEDITNANFNKVYQDQMLASMANTERDWRNYFTEGNLQRRADWRTIDSVNMLNAPNDQFAYVPGSGIVELNNKASDLSLPSLTEEQVKNMTGKQVIDYYNKSKQKSTYTNKPL